MRDDPSMISQKAKYALRALLALADLDAVSISAAELAEHERIPRKFLEQILADLKRDGLVQSRRGAAGGYALLKPADTITFGHVLRLIDGPIAPLPCLSRIVSKAYAGIMPCMPRHGADIRQEHITFLRRIKYLRVKPGGFPVENHMPKIEQRNFSSHSAASLPVHVHVSPALL